jgi:hypothetical protein
MLGARIVAQRSFPTENPQILDATVKNSAANMPWRPEFERPWNIHYAVDLVRYYILSGDHFSSTRHQIFL